MFLILNNRVPCDFTVVRPMCIDSFAVVQDSVIANDVPGWCIAIVQENPDRVVLKDVVLDCRIRV